MNATRTLTTGIVIALACFAAAPLAAAHEPNVEIGELPESPDPEDVKQYLSEKCTEVLQQLQPGRRCFIE